MTTKYDAAFQGGLLQRMPKDEYGAVRYEDLCNLLEGNDEEEQNMSEQRWPLRCIPGLEVILTEDGDLIVQEEQENDQCGQDPADDRRTDAG